jgi:hypothetical protein
MQPNGCYAGFFVNTGNVASVLGSISITTYNGSTPVETATGGSLLNLLTAGSGVLQFKTTAGSFDRIGINFSAVVGVAQVLDVYYGFTNATLLPLQFTAFDYQKRSSDLLLQWTTNNEVNNQYFVIEKSLNGYSFSEAGRLPASGAANGHYQYSLPLNEELNFYRIKQVDQNAKFAYSTTIVVKPAQSTFATWVYPNPVAGDNLQLNVYSSKAAQVTITIIDQSGKVIRRQQTAANTGNNILPVDAKQLLPGMYVLRSTNDKNDVISTCKFIKAN